MRQLVLLTFVIFVLSFMTGVAQSAASGTWALTTDGMAVNNGNVLADSIGTYTSTNITGFAGFSFGSTAPAGLKLGATGPTNWPADGSSTTANTSFTGLSTGTIRYFQFLIHPSAGNNLTVNSISVPLIENGSATNINTALAYSIDGTNFTPFNTNGLTGDALPANSLQTFSASPSLTVGSTGAVTVRIILWRKAGSTASSSSVTVGNVVLSGTTIAATSPTIALSTHGTISFGTTTVSNATNYQNFTVSGSNMTNDILITPPAGFEIRTGSNSFSTSPLTLTQSDGSVSLTNIDVRFNPTSTGAFSGNIACTSNNAVEQDVSVSGASPLYYYSKASGNLDALSTWTTDPNGGAGSSPSDFTSQPCYFFIKNNSSAALGANWTVSGTYSKVIVGDGINACKFTVPSAYTYSSPATEISPNAVLVLQNPASITTLGLTVDSDAVYQHDCNGAQLNGNFLNGSTINITAVTANNILLPPSCYNVIWNCPAQTAGGKIYNSDGTFSINGNLTVVSTGTGYCAVNTGSGVRTINIGGDLNIHGGSFRLLGASTGSGSTILNVAGNVAVSDSGVLNLSSTTNASPALANLNVHGNFIHSAGTVTKTSTTGAASLTFNGSVQQQFTSIGIGGGVGIVINNGSGVTLGSNINLNGTLTLTNGLLSTASDTLFITNNSAGAVTRTSGWLNGTLKRAFAASTGSYLFPIGTANDYRGATVNFTTAPVSASNLTSSFKPIDAASAGLPSGISYYWQKGFWTISADTIPGGVYSLSLDVNGITGVTAGDTKILQRESPADHWAVSGTYSDITSGVITDTGIVRFSQYTLGGNNSGLPVELTSFNAVVAGRKVNLTWTTATELNFDRFIIERTEDKSTDWKAIGIVKGNGNSLTAHSYSFTDQGAEGLLKYRLHIINNDGTGSFSKVTNTTVGLPDHFQVYQNYPNPFNPSTTVAFDIPSDSYIKIELYSVTGSKTAEIFSGNQAAGYQNVSIAMNKYTLSSGVYFYKVSGYDLASKKSFMTIKKMIYMK